MFDRRDIKRRARGHVKRHFILLCVLCAISIYMGSEFTNVVSNAQSWYNTLAGETADVDLEGVSEDRSFGDKLLDDMLSGNLQQSIDEANARLQLLKDAKNPNTMLGRQKGALAALVNNISSGRFYAMLAAGVNAIIHSQQFSAVVLVLGGLLVYIAVYVFVKNVYQAVLRRVALESRVYERVPMIHLLHIKLVGRWVRASLTLMLRFIFELLWTLTVVGGVIKHYSYSQVPFIVAENPDIKPREAIMLSRRMMNGHKWELFILDLSLLGWSILGYFTFGLADVLWGVPFRVATYSEYYARLRQEAKENELEGAALLNDDCLFEVADGATLRKRYRDIATKEELIDEDIIELSPRRRFFARNFGIWIGSLSEKLIYSRQAGLRQQAKIGRMEMEGRAYPERMNALWNHRLTNLTGRVSYLAPCTIWTYVVVFFAFCILGWVWEVSLHLVTHGEFVNRGTLHGPWLPIYGSGVVMIAILLYRFRSKPVVEAIAITVLCGFMEYITSYFLEASRGMRWWDYTGYFLNLNGRICGEGLAAFTVGGMAAVYLLIPLIDAMVTRIKPRILIPVCVLLMTAFSADYVYSQFVPNAGAGITDDPEVRAQLSSQCHSLSMQILRYAQNDEVSILSS